MEMRRIFSVVVCAVGIFFSMTAGSKDECLNSYVSADSLLLYEYYETYVMIRPTDISGAESCCAGLVSLSGQGDRTSCSCAEEAD